MRGRADVGTLTFAHEYDDDAVCTICGFDAAEHAHWRKNTYEGRAADEETRRTPPCKPRPVDQVDKTHDYPACAIFRGGRCTCD